MKTRRLLHSRSLRFGVSLTLLIAALLSGFGASAQEETVANRFSLKTSGAWGGWHTQLTSLGGESAVFQGGYGGLEFNKTIFIGWGLYKLQGEASFVLPTDGVLPVDVRFNGPMIYYTPHARRVLHPKFGLQAGFGRMNTRGLPEDKFLVLQPSVGGELNVFRWARLGAEVGYRLGLNVDDVGPGSDFVNGVYAQASLKFGFSWGSKNERRRWR